jgi:hypothetical protein
MLLQGVEVLGRTLRDLGHQVDADRGLDAARATIARGNDDLTPGVARRRGTR